MFYTSWKPKSSNHNVLYQLETRRQIISKRLTHIEFWTQHSQQQQVQIGNEKQKIDIRISLTADRNIFKQVFCTDSIELTQLIKSQVYV